jgi:hypothetical protein
MARFPLRFTANFLGLVSFIFLVGCSDTKQPSAPLVEIDQPALGMSRDQISSIENIVMTEGMVRNGYSIENIQFNGVLYVATYELKGDTWHNAEDILVELVRYEDSLEK